MVRIIPRQLSRFGCHYVKLHLRFDGRRIKLIDEMADGQMLCEFELNSGETSQHNWRVDNWSSLGVQSYAPGVGRGFMRFVSESDDSEETQGLSLWCGSGR